MRQLYDESELQQVIYLMLVDVIGLSRTDILLRKDDTLSESSVLRLSKYLDQLKSNKPLQYVLGYTWFSGLKFLVDENVLIPRPETEELIEWISSHPDSYRYSHLISPVSVVDIGAGSGCIAISLKNKFPESAVHAIDISKKAIDVARKNAELNFAEITFHEGDILSSDFQKSIFEKFDIIVSNPPYIRLAEMNNMSERVTMNEPHVALFVEDADPLIFYRSIADFAKTHLNRDGKLYFEINANLGKEVKDLLEESGFKNVELKKDMSGNDRLLMATGLPVQLIN